MSRRSRSPRRNRGYQGGSQITDREEGGSRRSYPRDDSRKDDRDRYGRGGDSSYISRRRDRDYRDYDEREREQERRRDRERYDDDRTRDRRRDTSRQRRSASPPSRSSRPRERSNSADAPSVDKSAPNFKPSGLLAAETNTVQAVDGTKTVLKYNEPPEARKPIQGWRLYVFKGKEQTEILHIHRQSAYLIGRDRLVADIALDHPSCSKQHAVIQYRYVQEKDEFGSSKGIVKPFVIDLESTNSTFVNDEAVPPARYYELKAGDVIKFGLSVKEYVLLHDDA